MGDVQNPETINNSTAAPVIEDAGPYVPTDEQTQVPGIEPAGRELETAAENAKNAGANLGAEHALAAAGEAPSQVTLAEPKLDGANTDTGKFLHIAESRRKNLLDKEDLKNAA